MALELSALSGTRERAQGRMGPGGLVVQMAAGLRCLVFLGTVSLVSLGLLSLVRSLSSAVLWVWGFPWLTGIAWVLATAGILPLLQVGS